MKKAWIKDGFVQDICPVEFDPIFAYGEEIGSNYVTDVPDDVGNGWQLNEHGTWVAPNFTPPPEPTPIPAPAAPTKEELLAQLQAIQAQIQAL